MRFNLSTQLIEKLRERNPGGHVAEEVMSTHNAFVLDLGLGPAHYLTLDGQVLVDERWFFGARVREATDDEAISALVAGARKTGVQELLSLIPDPPPRSTACPRCNGSRWATLGLKDVSGGEVRVVCATCSGRGWAA